jgi:hypothetical protein
MGRPRSALGAFAASVFAAPLGGEGPSKTDP